MAKVASLDPPMAHVGKDVAKVLPTPRKTREASTGQGRSPNPVKLYSRSSMVFDGNGVPSAIVGSRLTTLPHTAARTRKEVALKLTWQPLKMMLSWYQIPRFGVCQFLVGL